MPQTGIEPVREYKSRRILSPVRLPVPPLRQKKSMDGEGFEPSKAVPTDLQSAPFGHSGIHPYMSVFIKPDNIYLYHIFFRNAILFLRFISHNYRRIFPHVQNDFSIFHKVLLTVHLISMFIAIYITLHFTFHRNFRSPYRHGHFT